MVERSVTLEMLIKQVNSMGKRSSISEALSIINQRLSNLEHKAQTYDNTIKEAAALIYDVAHKKKSLWRRICKKMTLRS